MQNANNTNGSGGILKFKGKNHTVNIKAWIFGGFLQNGNDIIQNNLINNTQVGRFDVIVHELEQAGFHHFM